MTKPQVRVLTREILVVAKTTVPGCWKAYIGIVPGRNHDNEWPDVARTGDTLDRRIADFLFPDFAKQFEYDR